MAFDVNFHVKMDVETWGKVQECLTDMATAVAGALTSAHATAAKSSIVISELEDPPSP